VSSGVVSAMIMSLLVLRVLYVLFPSPEKPQRKEVERPAPELSLVGSL
jgi:hypothetical protein